MSEKTQTKKAPKVGFKKAMQFAPGSIIDIVLGTLAINILALALPFTLMQVYDRIIHQKAVGTLLVLVSGCAVAILFETLIHITRDRISSWAAARFEYMGMTKSFENLLRTPIDKIKFGGRNTITLLQELSSFSSIKTHYYVKNAQNFIDIPFGILNLYLLYMLIPSVAFFMVALICFIIIVHVFLYAAVYKARQLEQASVTRRDKMILETFQLINMIRAFTTEERTLRKIERNEETLMYRTLNIASLKSISSSFLQVIPQAAIFGVLMIGEQDVLTHKISTGVLTTSMMLAGRCIGPVISFVSGWLTIQDRDEQEAKANKLLTLEVEKWLPSDEYRNRLKGEVTFNNFTFEYQEGSMIKLCTLHLNIPPNTFFCFTTHNEKASNQLCDILMKNVRFKTGEIIFDDSEIYEIPISDFYKEVHSLSKNPVFFKGTVLENLASFDMNLYDKAIILSKELGLDEIIASFEMGFNSNLDSEVILSTSSSLLMRISITRALIKNPRILILDNLESGMDLETKKFFNKFLQRIRGKCTVIAITSSAETLGMAHKIVSLSETSVVSEKTVKKDKNKKKPEDSNKDPHVFEV